MRSCLGLTIRGLILASLFALTSCRTPGVGDQSSTPNETQIIFNDDQIFKLADNQVVQIVIQEAMIAQENVTNTSPTIGVWLSTDYKDLQSAKNTIKIAQISGPTFKTTGQVISREGPLPAKRQASKVATNWSWKDVVELDGAEINKRAKAMKSNFIRLSLDATVGTTMTSWGGTSQRAELANNDKLLTRFGEKYAGKRGGIIIGDGDGDILMLGEVPGKDLVQIGFQARVIDKDKKANPFAKPYTPRLGKFLRVEDGTIKDYSTLTINYSFAEHQFPVGGLTGNYHFFSTAKIVSGGAVVADLGYSQTRPIFATHAIGGGSIVVTKTFMGPLLKDIEKINEPKLLFEIREDGYAMNPVVISETIDLKKLAADKKRDDHYSGSYGGHAFKIVVSYVIY